VSIFYALASTGELGAERLRRHVNRLPDRCGPGPEPGLREPALETWLDRLNVLAAEPDNRIRLQARRVRFSAVPNYSKR
jgi:hypothetical protein